MFFTALAATALTLTSLQTAGPRGQTTEARLERSAFGVPEVTAPTRPEAWRLIGRAVAEDRLWQLELSRRGARGQLAEILGPSAVGSDTEVLRRAYTDAEMAEMFRRLPEPVQADWRAYTDGINEVIERRTTERRLPKGYTDANFTPRKWEVNDSVAIAILMARRFGNGGAGELRNLAMIRYLETRRGVPVLDVLDDLAWQNDPQSLTTVARADDPVKNPPVFPNPTRAETEAHLAKLPKTNLLELAGGVRAAIYEENTDLMAELAVPYKVGSYAVVVSKERSATGTPILLGAPQMGHTQPSVAYEVWIDVPGFQVSGLTVPGVPTVLLGHTPHLAWTLTSGVADIEDVIVSRMQGTNGVISNAVAREMDRIDFPLRVRGEERPRTVTQMRTIHGPVLLMSRSSQAVYSLKSSLWMRELSSFGQIDQVGTAKTAADIDRITRSLVVTFNFFFATVGGEIGYRYVGAVPVRAMGIDPRLPTPDEAAYQWRGFLSPAQMPRVDNPSRGLIVNWNNKPATWWPNLDTPAWGRPFRNEVLAAALTAPKLSVSDVEHSAWEIARRDAETSAIFLPDFARALTARAKAANRPLTAWERELVNWDGWTLGGSVGAVIYRDSVAELRRVLYAEALGDFAGNFDRVLQPAVLRRALDGQVRFRPWGREPMGNRMAEAFDQALAKQQAAGFARWNAGLRPGTMPSPAGLIPYNDRGTFIQVVEMLNPPRARSVSSPGVSEEGEHVGSQAMLAASWTYKPVRRWSKP